MDLVPPLEESAVLEATRHWIERVVIGLSLCPFARAVYRGGLIRYVVSQSLTAEALEAELSRELEFLHATDPGEIDTTLLINPWVLTDFLDHNDFAAQADATVEALGLAGELQVASFHPQFRFSGNRPDDPANCVNRSPFPTLHLLRETSVDRAVAAFPDASLIYNRNIETLRRIGLAGYQRVTEAASLDEDAADSTTLNTPKPND